jgi:GTPase SAR1 family protein
MPIIVWIIAATALGVISVFGGFLLHRWLKAEHTVAFIGRQGAGKTTMLQVLSTGHLPDSPTGPTTEQYEEEVLVEATVFRIIDSGGDRLNQWLVAGKRAGHVVYFFDASLVARRDPAALSAIAADAEQIRTEMSRGGDTSRFVLCGTHADLFTSDTSEAEVRKNREIQKLKNACNIGDEEVLLGSLSDRKSAMTLTSKVFKLLMRASR